MNCAFINAKPVFIKNNHTTVNFQAGFRCKFEVNRENKYVLKIAGATLFRIYLNNEFIHYGPARAPHGYIRYDEIDLNVRNGENILCVEVAGYNCPSFYTMNIKSFLQAEIFENSNSYKYTGRDFLGFPLTDLRKQKVYRYSFQRAFCEVWNFDNSSNLTNWKTSDISESEVNVYPIEQELLERGLPIPKFDLYNEYKLYEKGEVRHKNNFDNYKKRFITGLNYEVIGFPVDTCEDDLLDDMNLEFIPCNIDGQIKGTYTIYEFSKNNTGFIKTEITAKEDSVVYLFFSETLLDGKINCGIDKDEMLNIIKYSLSKSDIPYSLETFEAYGLKYLGVYVKEGNISVNSVSLREYSYPLYQNTRLKCSNSLLEKIFNAAVETFRQNTLDIFMDCPTRERAGWLCDSYFTGQGEPFYAGNNECEKVFLTNFILAMEFPGLPAGMLPMCYPGEILNGAGYIDQWAMWYVLELYGYIMRNGADADSFKDLVYNLFKYFEKYTNSDGLLEGLPGIQFVEFSEANRFAREASVSYPTNMLYYKALRLAAELYNDDRLLKKSDKIKSEIVRQAFDGRFFIDSSVRNENGILQLTENRSEMCQYSAIFFDIIDKDDIKYRELKNAVINVFGPERKKGVLDNIQFSSGFTGHMMRMELLTKIGEYDKALSEMESYYGKMANITGTLWELEIDGSSLNHGFKSAVGVVIIQCLTGIKDINYKEKTIKMIKDFQSKYDFDISIGLQNETLRIKQFDDKTEISGLDRYNINWV